MTKEETMDAGALRAAALGAYWAWQQHSPDVALLMEQLYAVASPPLAAAREPVAPAEAEPLKPAWPTTQESRDAFAASLAALAQPPAPAEAERDAITRDRTWASGYAAGRAAALRALAQPPAPASAEHVTEDSDGLRGVMRRNGWFVADVHDARWIESSEWEPVMRAAIRGTTPLDAAEPR